MSKRYDVEILKKEHGDLITNLAEQYYCNAKKEEGTSWFAVVDGRISVIEFYGNQTVISVIVLLQNEFVQEVEKLISSVLLQENSEYSYSIIEHDCYSLASVSIYGDPYLEDIETSVCEMYLKTSTLFPRE